MAALAQDPKVVDRGPNWLFVRVPADGFSRAGKEKSSSLSLADQMWKLCSRHFVYRMVLELQDVTEIDDRAADELLRLQKMLAKHDGALRLCGLPSKCSRKILNLMHRGILTDYDSRLEAVIGDSGTWRRPDMHEQSDQVRAPKMADRPQQRSAKRQSSNLD